MSQIKYLWLAVEPWQQALLAACGLVLLWLSFRKRLKRWGAGSVGSQRQSFVFRVVALWLIAGLYVPWFFLPIIHINGPTYGGEVIIMSFLIPPWHFAAGHLLLWIGAQRLASMRWRTAMILGVSAALLSVFWMQQGVNRPYVLGAGLRIASTCALAIAGVVGHLWFGRKFPPGHCVKCGYNLTGNVSGRCPECGTPARMEPQMNADKRG